MDEDGYGILNLPHEWGWTYTMLIVRPALFRLTDAGRSLGERAAARGSRMARLVR